MAWLSRRRSRDAPGSGAAADPRALGVAGSRAGDAEDPVDEALRVLADAGTVAFGPVGFAAAVLPETEAFQTVQGQQGGAALLPRLERLLAEATPAGRIYAAVLIDGIDPEAGQRAWQRLAADRDVLGTMSGCLMDRTTVAEYAGHRLG